ncbi:MAG TPA: hypothetical protein VNB49_14670 [Candidatus Dormibacteraeota bacterium]|nr:hypothetical protein [Candidatus Dormibacteraeota bacterium]
MSYGGKKWHRAMDYEIVRFTTDEDPQAVKKRCIAAIRALGHRLERCLEGNRMAKTFVEAMNMGEAGSGNGIDAFAPNSVLYSVGPVPRMLDHDDDPILCEFDGPDYQVKSNRCQIRFGYYAQTVPGEALLNMPQVSNA